MKAIIVLAVILTVIGYVGFEAFKTNVIEPLEEVNQMISMSIDR